MRFLILTQYFPPEIGAPQGRLGALARELVRLGHQAEVVTAMPNHLIGRIYPGYRGKLYIRENWHGIPVHRTWVYAATGTGIRRMLNYASFCITSLFGLFKARKPDVVFVESPPLFLAMPGWLAAKLAGAKLIFNVADLWPDVVSDLGVMRDGPMLRWAGRLETWAYREAAFVNAVTPGVAERLRSGKAVDENKILFLPNGIDTNLLRPKQPNQELAMKLGIAGRTVFLYAGTHGIVHGLHHVIDAAALVDPREIVLLFVGAGTTKASLVERAKRMQLENVIFHPPVPLERVADFYSLAYAAICPVVRSEHAKTVQPSKLFSACACGVPVIYCGEGEGANVIRNAEAGIVVEPESAPALARAMTELRLRPDRRDLLAKSARRVAESDFGWDRIVESWLAGLEARHIG